MTFVQDILLGSSQLTSVLTFTRDEQRAKCGGSCWRSLTTNFDRQLLHKKGLKCGINARIDLFTNGFHRWCSRMCAGHNILANQDATRVRVWNRWPTRARNQQYKSQYLCQLQVGPGRNPWTERGGRCDHWEAGRPAGRPTRPMGPTASTLPHGAPSLAPNVGSIEKSCDLGVARSYKYKGRGRGMNTHTHTHHTLSTHLSPLELEAFILDD